MTELPPIICRAPGPIPTPSPRIAPVPTAAPSLLSHRLPRYVHAPESMRATYPGEYVHELHAQALAERVILADTALRQGRVGQAHELIREAVDYLRRGNHTR